MKNKTKESLFKMEIKARPEAHKLSIALSMVGVHLTIHACALILQAQKSIAKMGEKFDLKTAAKIKENTDNFFTEIENNYNSQ